LAGARLQTPLGSHCAPPYPLAGYNGSYVKGRGEERRVGIGKGRAPPDPLSIRLMPDPENPQFGANCVHCTYLERCRVVANFLLQYLNFRYHGNGGWSETNFTTTVKLVGPEKPLVQESRTYLLYCRVIANFLFK